MLDSALIVNLIKSIVHRAGRVYLREVCKSQSEAQRFTHHNERAIEYRFALQAMAENRPKTVLDVGTGATAWPNLLRTCGFLVTAIDNVTDYWPEGMVNQHSAVEDVDITKPGLFSSRRFESITCISVLEHIVEFDAAVKNMLVLLDKGGYLVLTCPYSHHEFCENCYQRPDALYGRDAPYICRSYSSAQLERWLSFGAVLEKREFWRLFSGPVWAAGTRVDWEQVESPEQPHQLGCFVIRKT